MTDQPDEAAGTTAEDGALEAGLRIAAQRFDPLPEAVRSGAIAAYAWRDLDSELELLTVEAAEAELAGVRSTAVGRFLTLSSDRLVIELEVFPAAGAIDGNGGMDIRGLALLAPVTTVEVRPAGPETPITADVDAGGRFALNAVPSGAVRLVFGDETGPRYASEWLTL